MLSHWKDLITRYGGNIHNAVLIGTKCDLAEKCEVMRAQGQALADENIWPFFETSAKENINVTEAFMTAARIGQPNAEIKVETETAKAKAAGEAKARAAAAEGS